MIRCAVILIAIAGIIAQSVPSVVYNYNPHPEHSITLRGFPVSDMQSNMFWIVYDDWTLQQTFAQQVDPIVPSNSKPAVSLASAGIVPGMERVMIEPLMMGRAAVVTAYTANGQPSFAYYDANAGVVTGFPSSTMNVGFGDTVPSWNDAFDIANGLLNAMSHSVFIATGCNATYPNSFFVQKFDVRKGAPGSTSLLWTSVAIQSPNCASIPLWARNFLAYEEQVWFTNGQGTVYGLFSNGSIQTTLNNPCNFSFQASQPYFNMRFVNLGMDTTPGKFGPIYGFILSYGVAGSSQVSVCRISHRTFGVEWSTNVTTVANQLTFRVSSAGSQVLSVFSSGGPGFSGITLLSFLNVVNGSLAATISRPLGDQSSYPAALAAPIGGCATPVVFQQAGSLTAYCALATGLQYLWTSTVGCLQLPISHPTSSVIACTLAQSAGIALVSSSNGNVVWIAGGNTWSGQVLVTQDMLWAYTLTGHLEGLSLVAALPIKPTQPPSTTTAAPALGSTGGPAVSSGTAAAVSILMLVVGGVIGAAVAAQYRKKKESGTYSEVLQ